MATFDDASLELQRTLDTELVESSLDAGWRSTLIELRRCREASREVWLRPTPDLHLVVQVSGRQRVEVNRRGIWASATYGPGAAGITPGGGVEHLRSHCDRPYDILHLFLPHLVLEDAGEMLRRAGQSSIRGGPSALLLDDPLLVGTSGALLAAMRAGTSDLYAEQAMHWLATHLLVVHGHADPHAACASREWLGDPRLARTIALIRFRYADPLTLDELASEAGVSKFHFSRLFRERTGLSPHAYLTKERIAAARDLLVGSDLSIGAIARRVGYAGSVQFTAAFRRSEHCTPTAFRQARSRTN